MDANKIKAMQAHCDELTRDGKELSVTWEGGNDSGWFELELNGEKLENPSPLEEDILQFVADHMGYGSFAGDYTTDGTLSYDPEEKCFSGLDSFTTTDQGRNFCSIEVRIPESIWFDSLKLFVNTEGGFEDIETSVSLQILNGPHPDDFDEMKLQMEANINTQFCNVISHIENFSEIWEEYILPRAQFEYKDGFLHYCISEFSYSVNETEDNEINVSFLD